ncbi:hypothetical protein [Catenuloplanes indicus]|uniref:Uncharacterized protein n=1 Tax=Catenuloplanes indicus TaxID=137267 RepID=A0AAE4B2A8_9ACTN|nr:hypothetical protein [Catenuloplanes indicus]
MVMTESPPRERLTAGLRHTPGRLALWMTALIMLALLAGLAAAPEVPPAPATRRRGPAPDRHVAAARTAPATRRGEHAPGRCVPGARPATVVRRRAGAGGRRRPAPGDPPGEPCRAWR